MINSLLVEEKQKLYLNGKGVVYFGIKSKVEEKQKLYLNAFNPAILNAVTVVEEKQKLYLNMTMRTWVITLTMLKRNKSCI